ncbi:MAG TPA: CDP-diacylglycerol--serine O-phosphatidyltransferase [Thermoanaerobaculaceae bacterium]|nr:CDP-diacylglycerol--serine O-phosphatidyltransferase [Thermoanaerobaculaceae bacterium]
MRVPRPPRPRRARRPRRESLRRGIYVIPSLFTVGNMLCGFASVLWALHDELRLAAYLIIGAGFLDGLDGRIARLTHSTSEFGKEYDSLADVISFGVAPAILTYQWGLRGLGQWGWGVAFLFLVAGSVRLARFNIKAGVSDRRFFTGLPIPAGAGALTLMVLVGTTFELIVDRPIAVAASMFVLLVSVLMVSTVPYRSGKEFNLRQRWPATAFFTIAALVAVVVFTPVPALALLLGVYVVAGPAEYVARRLRRRAVVQPAPQAQVPSALGPSETPDRP